MLNLEYEKEYLPDYVAGVDEVGYGSLVGDVFAAAAILDLNDPEDQIDFQLLSQIKDSKQFNEKARKEIYLEIINSPYIISALGSANLEEIERYNILHASRLAMKRAIQKLPKTPKLILVDGKIPIANLNICQKTIIKGDKNSYGNRNSINHC